MTGQADNPYLLDTPAVVSFSGGRTSAFMLRQILDAFGGLPEGMVVCFQNTGLEHPATYKFIREVEERWLVPVTWLEYDLDDGDEPTFKVVDFESAARDGEPFTKLILKKGYLPNPVSRICTVQLKLRTQQRYLKSLPAFQDGYTSAVGLRADEPRRATRLRGDTSMESPVAPMYEAGHTEQDVLRFWAEADFDLDLPLTGNMAGNCVGCFLKSRSKLYTLAEEMPEHFDWWVRAEKLPLPTKTTGDRFRQDRPSYAAMVNQARIQGNLFAHLDDEDTISCMCTD